MGLDIHARLVIGFQVKYEIKKEEVIRYDVITGKPFQATRPMRICSHGECTNNLEEFRFGYAEEDEEYSCIRGKSIHYSPSNRLVDDPFEMMMKIDFPMIYHAIAAMQKQFPEEKIEAYFYADPNW